jgi:hypothetical protein
MMMIKIHRYPLAITDHQIIQMPQSYPDAARGVRKLLAVAESREFPGTALDLWARVDDSLPLDDVHMYVVGTGNPFPEAIMPACGWHVGTVVMSNGLVWHVFSERPQG